jgi:hypothetical protein
MNGGIDMSYASNYEPDVFAPSDDEAREELEALESDEREREMYESEEGYAD